MHLKDYFLPLRLFIDRTGHFETIKFLSRTHQPKDDVDDFFRSLEEEKAKRGTEREKPPARMEAVQVRENYKGLKIDEEKLRKAAREDLGSAARRQA